MSIEILHRYTKAVLYQSTASTLKDAVVEAVNAGADLRGADLRGADLQDANLRDADLRDSYLRGADLRGANLQDADLRDSYLQDADLRGADLQDADLQDADLRGAKGITANQTTPLMFLYDQPGTIRLYKLVNEKSEGPYNGGIVYEIGQSYEVHNANTDPNEDCGAGINVATLDWCLRAWRKDYRILTVDFTAQDIACVPLCTDGKIRLTRCFVSGEKDLKALGLVQEEVGDGK